MCVASSENVVASVGQQSRRRSTTTTTSIWRLAMCTVGICSCYLYYGFLQERLFTKSSRHHRLGATIVLVTQCVTNCLVALVWQQFGKHHKFQDQNNNKKPLRHGLLLAASVCYVGAMSSSNEAIQYVSYPVAVLAKSCKLIPTMLVGQLVERKGYSRLEWMAALLISTGIGLFHWNHHNNSRMFHHQRKQSSQQDTTDEKNAATRYGMMLLLFSLTLDGILSSCQNWIKQRPRPDDDTRTPNAVETMLWMNLYALVTLIPLAVATGQWNAGIELLWFSPEEPPLQDDYNNNNDWSLASKIALLNATVAFGQIFIFLTIAWFSPIVTTTITTTRKFFTILLSVWAYGHPFTAVQWTAVGLVFSGLYLSILMVSREKEELPAADDDNKSKTD